MAHCFQHYYNQIIVTIFTSAASHNMHTADAMQNKEKQKYISTLGTAEQVASLLTRQKVLPTLQ
jgi:hypothetical protein